MGLRDLLTEEQRSELVLIKKAAVEIWDAPLHRHYTDHKPQHHSERIITKLDQLVENLAPPLNPVEAYILLAAAYLHDIGMQNSNTKYKTLDEIREHHHTISRDMIIGSVTNPPTYRTLNMSAEYAEEIALVSAAHRRLDLSSEDFDDRPKGSSVLRLRLMSALLRLSDALDMDYKRVIMENLAQEPMEQTSRLHWWRCHYIEAIDIRNGMITVNLALPSEDYIYYLKASIVNEVRDEVSKLQDILWPYVKLTVAESHTPRIARTKIPMLEEDFARLRREVLQRSEEESAKTISQILDLRGREERIARQAAEEGHRLSGSDPPQARELLKQAATLYLQLELPNLAITQLEAMAKLCEAMDDRPEAALAHEEVGILWLKLDEPFVAKSAFHIAAELTPEVPEASTDEQSLRWRIDKYRRLFFEAKSSLLWGEFASVDQWLAEIENDFVGTQVHIEIAAAFFETLIHSHLLQHRWKEGLRIAQLMVSDFLHRTDDIGRVNGYSNASLIASHAGEHDQASEWIQAAFEAAKNLGDENDSLSMHLHSRRGLIRMRSGHLIQAEDDFRVAWERAELIGDTSSSVAQFDNLLTVISMRSIPLRNNPVVSLHLQRMRDLSPAIRRPGEEARLKLNHGGSDSATQSALLVASVRAVLANDFSSWNTIRKSLASLYRKAKRPLEASRLWVASGADTELTTEFEALSEINHPSAGLYAAELVLDVAASDEELQTAAHAVAIVADVIPSSHAEAVAERLISAAEAHCTAVLPDETASKQAATEDSRVQTLQPAGALMPLNKLMPALAALAPQMSPDQARRCIAVCERGLFALPPGGRLVREASAQTLCALVTHIAEGEGGRIVCRARELAATEDFDFWLKFSAILEPSLEAQARDEIRKWFETQAEDNNVTAAQIVTQKGWGPLHSDTARNIVQAQIKGLRTVVETTCRSAKPSFTTGLGTSGDRALADIESLLQPPNLDSDDVILIVNGLRSLGNHPENTPVGRQLAIGVLGLLAERTHIWCESGWIDQSCIEQVIQTFEEVAVKPEIGSMQRSLADGADDILNPIRLKLGTFEQLRANAITSLGRWTLLMDSKAVTHAADLLLGLCGAPEDSIRRAGLVALKYAAPHLDANYHLRVLRKIEIALHDNTVAVQSAATWALPTFSSGISQEDASSFIQRLAVLSSSPDRQVRINAAHAMKKLAEYSAFQQSRELIVTCLESMRHATSFVLRTEVERLLTELK